MGLQLQVSCRVCAEGHRKALYGRLRSHLAEMLRGLAQHEENRTSGCVPGQKTTLRATGICFNDAGLNKLTSHVMINNPHSQRSTLALGFEQEGLRQAHFHLSDKEALMDSFENGLTVSAFRASPRLARLSQRLLGRNIVANSPVTGGQP